MQTTDSAGDLGSLGVAAAPIPNDEATPQKWVHPEAAALFHAAPCTQHIPIFSKSFEGYGPRCVSSLGLCYFLNKGLANYLMSYSRFAMFTDRFGIDGTRYQRLQSISKMGWSVKAFTASLSDAFALFGYTKRWYCGSSAVLGGAFALGFALLPQKTASADIAAGFLFLSNFCMANIDILSEGHYSRLMRQHPDSGPALVSLIWWFILAASIVSAAIQGPLSDMKKPQIGLYVSAACQFVSTVFFIFNWFDERRNREERLGDARALHAEIYKLQIEARREHDVLADVVAGAAKDLHPEHDDEPSSDHNSQQHLSDELVLGADVGVDAAEEDEMWSTFEEPKAISLCCGAVEFNKEVCLRNWRVLVYSAVMVCSAVAMTCVTILGTTWDLFYAAIAVAVVNCALAFWATPLVIAKAIVFIYFNMLLYLQINGAMDSFYMAKEECYPDGPHFSYVFYTTIAAIIGNIGGMVGVTAFTYIFSKHSYCMTFIVTTIVQVLGSIFDIIIVERWNLYIGIPDHAMYIMGDSIVYEVCYMLSFMPMIVLISRICPRGSESMIYALVASFANMGQSMSSTIGSILLEKAWPIVTKGAGKCDYHNLSLLLVVGHLCLPMLIVPLSFLLLPRARICDDIDVDGHVIRVETKRRMAKLETNSSSEETAEEPFRSGDGEGEGRK
ncbi:putative folate/biopterin transporter [Leptomonas pyrrhocoris]|uniref:Putative folate/biopterin transporter n=1 Tax=Leptomonas pyrrhocoris TaxID=157538 RepID=A0A0M9FWF6_LEPPY|nr:putative folate/biopterin transporter [Leptomonas pyrrhocoris]XP_015655798.1 putative folate/biopterin transporter [Leptomonas pyrrhocoris]KPA77358.1 putative folate/biopterin transporter [Leptomonas pyrrhocoris]KPA77359.1 putative folate/biopterin transporter [Leptomonas pyrrhocoris]|eukprot:XP_015655797.1 putative folate/biopterin transporter [Leptomonas pyrrhocoris]